MTHNFSRRDFFRAGALTALATAGAASVAQQTQQALAAPPAHPGHDLGIPTLVGDVNHQRNGFNPSDLLTDFDTGQVSELITGQTLREYQVTVTEQTLELVPGIEFPAWTYNGRIPGPAIRCVEGERVRILFSNQSSRPHSMHFHGVHPAEMDGVPGSGIGLVGPGEETIYEFEAEPFGVHLYHGHSYPLAQNIGRGLFGAFIVEPKEGWPPVDRELLMVLNSLDLNLDDRNDFYAVNTIPFHYQKLPIPIGVGEQIRLFLINMVEGDPLVTFHLHGNFFHYYPTGTRLTPSEFTDTIALAQAQRGILEFSYKFPGLYLFRAQNARLAELGCLGLFNVGL